MRHWAAIATYLLALLGGTIIFNADQGAFTIAYLVWLLSSLAVGFATGQPWLFLLPLGVAFPLGAAFGYTENYVGSDAPWVPLHVVLISFPSAALVLAGAGLRISGDRGQPSDHDSAS